MFTDQLVHADGTVYTWLVSTSPDEMSVTLQLDGDGNLAEVTTRPVRRPCRLLRPCCSAQLNRPRFCTWPAGRDGPQLSQAFIERLQRPVPPVLTVGQLRGDEQFPAGDPAQTGCSSRSA